MSRIFHVNRWVRRAHHDRAVLSPGSHDESSAMAIKMKDVAERAGVSLITVSRVINGAGYVHTETRAKVRAAIKELQYVPNQMASSLRSRQTRTIALLLPTITNSFWTTIARGA